MATYKGIKGFKIQSLASDPTAEDTVGKIWYNTAGNVLKYSAEGAGAWASGTATPTPSEYGKCTRTPSSLLLLVDQDTQEWNGSAWSEKANLTNPRNRGGCAGTTTAALYFGGSPPSNKYTESWDGSTWTTVNELNSGKNYFAQTGTQTAAISAGGEPQAGITEIWNGTGWSEEADLNNPRSTISGCKNGSTTAFLAFGGYSAPSVRGYTEEWNGVGWTTVNELTTPRDGVAGAGTTSAALCGGGSAGPPGAQIITEQWNGTGWTEVADMATAGYLGGCAGSTTSALVGGRVGATTTVEEWADPVYSVQTVTTS